MKAEGDGALRLKTLRTMRVAAQPLVPKVKAAAATRLPQSGGLAQSVSSRKVSVVVSTAARTAGVRLKMAGGDAGKTNAGYVTHPTFGDDQVWQSQQIPGASGWWTDTLRNAAPVVTAALTLMMTEVAAELEG